MFAGDVLPPIISLSSRRLQTKTQGTVIDHMQVVFIGLAARIGQHRDLGPRSGSDQPGQIAHPVVFGHLVQNIHPFAPLRRVLQRQIDTAAGILDVDEGAGLAFGAMHGQRIADRGLHQEPVQRRAVIPVLVETVYQPVIPAGFLGLRA